MNYIHQQDGVGYFQIFGCNFQCNFEYNKPLVTTSTIMLINVKNKQLTICKMSEFRRILKANQYPLNLDKIYKITFTKSFTIVPKNKLLYEYIIRVKNIDITNTLLLLDNVYINNTKNAKYFFFICRIIKITIEMNKLCLHCSINNTSAKIFYWEQSNNNQNKAIINVFNKFLNKLLLLINIDIHIYNERKIYICNKHSIFALLENKNICIKYNKYNNQYKCSFNNNAEQLNNSI